MKRILFASTFALFVAGFAANAPVALANNEDKVQVCHIPPGNPDNAHTIVIGASGVSAHLDHGDYVGECIDIIPLPL